MPNPLPERVEVETSETERVWLTFYDMFDWEIVPATDGTPPDRTSQSFDSRIDALEYVAAHYRVNRRSISAQLKRIYGMMRRERAATLKARALTALQEPDNG